MRGTFSLPGAAGEGETELPQAALTTVNGGAATAADGDTQPLRKRRVKMMPRARVLSTGTGSFNYFLDGVAGLAYMVCDILCDMS